eukprot:TRINITY_DN21944_c0_g1_i2.p1 TRINITY_DN21944_c0_g1~~TRINITY_DN21944_c0_g1_i2.p1  ORF type:complete len:462 (-),score=63.84 TRINITY_DN21944_c0_g1_i2:314-1699(-)
MPSAVLPGGRYRCRSADAAAGVPGRHYAQPSSGKQQLRSGSRRHGKPATDYGVPLCRAAIALDSQFEATMQRVGSALVYAPRHMRARGEAWSQRLNMLAAVPQEELRRDRNLQAELLLQCLEEERWTEPLNRHPPQGPLPTLPPHVACAVRRKRTERERTVGIGATCPRYHPPADRLGDGQFLYTDELSSQLSSEVESEEPSLASFNTAGISSLHTAGQNESLAQAAARQFSLLAANTSDEALGDPSLLVAGVASPPAYASLAARVAHLQDENRRLRQRLSGPPSAVLAAPPATAFMGSQSALRDSAAVGAQKRASSTGQLSRHRDDGLAAGAKHRVGAAHEPSLGSTSGVRPGYSDARSAMQGSEPLAACEASHWLTSRQMPELSHSHSSAAAALASGPCPTLGSSLLAEQSAISSPYLAAKTPAAPAVPPGPAPPEGDVDGFLRYLDQFQAYTGSLCSA